MAAIQGIRLAHSLTHAWFKILGANTKGTSPSILLILDKSRYLFNCGENLQRLFMEINSEVKLKALKGIFLTRPLWDRFSAIYNYTSLRLLLEIGEKDTPNFEIFSANMDSVIGSLIDSGKERYNSVDVSTGKLYEDKDILIQPILIEKFSKHAKMPDKEMSFLDATKPRNEDVTVAYYGELHDILGKINVDSVEKCGLENKYKLLRKLAHGREVALPSGRVVKPEECVGPIKLGASFLILECPNKEFIAPILSCEKLENLRNSKERILKVLVHLAPQSVVDTSQYFDWMKSFGDKTEHLIILTDKKERIPNFGQKVQCVLNLVSPTFYPIRRRVEITAARQPDMCENMHIVDSLCNYFLHPFSRIEKESKQNFEFIANKNQSECLEEIYKQMEESFEHNKIRVYKQDLINTTENTNKHFTPLDHYRELMDGPPHQDLTPLKGDPLVIFLGTGASSNTWHRGTACILILDAAKNSYMLDCGEGAFMQICDKFGENANDILSSLKLIFVSHRHTDHFAGLLRVLSEREKIVGKRNEKVLVIGPTLIGERLRFYSKNCEELCYEFLPLKYTEKGLDRKRCEKLSLRSLQGVRVKHCYDSFGVSIEHKEGWRIVYSGDTLPADALVALGRNCDLLIHEATFETGLEKQAIFKKHCTTREAIEIADRMRARFTILTHFSSRYCRLPKFEEDFVARNVAVAFDFMTVRLSQLRHLISAQKCIREIVPKFLKQSSKIGSTWDSLDSWDPYEDEDFCY